MFLKPGHRPDHGFDEPLGLLSDCHRRIEHFLDVLITIHAQSAWGELLPMPRAQLEGAVRYFAEAAPRHTADEEESLFPKLRASRDPGAEQVLDVLQRLERDHGDAGEHHRAVDRLARKWLTEGALPPADAGALGAHLRALKALYDSHIAIEDAELFPAAGRVLTAAELGEIGREMADRRSIRPLKIQ
jgi:hemerythrin-like domain-containing protein